MERLAGVRRGRSPPEEGSSARPELAVFTLAGADTTADIRLLSRALADRGFAERDVDPQRRVRGAPGRHGPVMGRRRHLRAGCERRWRRARTAAMVRLDALGQISGDWGGGTDVGWEGLAGAVRARDGRGPRTRLERDVPAYFGLPSPAAFTALLSRGDPTAADRRAVTRRVRGGGSG